MGFKKAVKYNAKLRMALVGPAGSGKTWTALTLATALAGGGSIALIDTEHGSASKYADQFAFDTLELSNFHPQHYINAIHEAETAGYSVLIIDSLSHAWNGTGGALELVDTVAKRAAAKSVSGKPNSFNAWGEVTPIQNQLIDAILGSSIHVIATIRSKTEYVVENNKPRKIGIGAVQRADIEYEFDIYADMTIDNDMVIQKSRCPALSGQVVKKPNGKVADALKVWLAGTPPPQIAPTGPKEPAQPTLISDAPPPAASKNGGNISITRLATIYVKVKGRAGFQDAPEQKNYTAFYAECGKILKCTVSSAAHLTDSRLTTIEQFLDGNAVQMEAAQAS